MSSPPPTDAGRLDGLADAPLVGLPTWEFPSTLQTVIGKVSPVSADLEEFRGIPYGTVAARWEQSQLRTRLPRDVFEATRNGPKCTQPSGPNDSRTYQAYLPFPDDGESELDCLNLFVVRPSPAALERRGIAPGTRVPVLVWIHGGGLAFGAATDPIWDPARLVLRALDNGAPIVAVSVNYRLNLFGFAASADILAAQDPTTTGGLNFGLRDQKVALEWVARNIAAFGGDPERVTVGGQSAGSVSSHAQLLDSKKKRLFRRVLLHSGALGTLGPDPLETREQGWQQLYEALFGAGSFGAASPQERVARLRQVPASRLLETSERVHNDVFAVVADDVTMSLEADDASSTLPSPWEAPSKLAVDLGPVDLRNAPSRSPTKGIDVLLGVTDLESSIFISGDVSFDHIQSKFQEACGDADVHTEIMEAYGLTASATSGELLHGLRVFLSDAMFEVPVHLTGKALRAKEGCADIGHVQSFHVKTGNPFPGPHEGVAHHCVELIYLFEAFHTALADADQGIRRPYTELGEEKAEVTDEVKQEDMPTEVIAKLSEPEQGVTSTPPESRSGLDAGDQSPAGQDVAVVDAEEVGAGEITYKRTNIELSHAIQDYWLNFIVADDWTPTGGPESVLVYGKDRGTEVESLVDDPAWQQRRRRWELLVKNPEAMMRAREIVRR